MRWNAVLPAVMILCLPVACAWADTFTNGAFESGNLNGWTQGGGYWYGGWPINPQTYLPGGSNYSASGIRNTVVSQGTDPISGLNTVYSGSYSARINNDVQDYSVSVLSQTVNNYTDPNIYFAWAANLEGSHGLDDSDNFTIQLTDNTTGNTLYNVSYSSASAAGTSLFTQNPKNDWYYTQWQVANLDVSGFAGDTFTLTLLASDCPYGGHAGYVYLDGFGAAPPAPIGATPEPSSLLLLGTGVAMMAVFARSRMRAAGTGGSAF